MKLGQKAFVQDHGNHCPCCGSEQVAWDHLEVNDDEVTQDAKCLICDKRFMSVYKLKGYYLVERKNESLLPKNR